MMNIEAQRKSIIHRILDVKNEELLSKIDELLNADGYIYSVQGDLLTQAEFKNQVLDILQVSEDGEVYTTEELRNKILKK
ncbi:hypothetical protein WFZ85_08630 [Flavobacterium sp. j3]|uniref:Uncharacterized protein n=1 Tax=Flavobacterium aureirubrum TaxID=3133147 RepID=A0ABU9N584_9FLAO